MPSLYLNQYTVGLLLNGCTLVAMLYLFATVQQKAPFTRLMLGFTISCMFVTSGNVWAGALPNPHPWRQPLELWTWFFGLLTILVSIQGIYLIGYSQTKQPTEARIVLGVSLAVLVVHLYGMLNQLYFAGRWPGPDPATLYIIFQASGVFWQLIAALRRSILLSAATRSGPPPEQTGVWTRLRRPQGRAALACRNFALAQCITLMLSPVLALLIAGYLTIQQANLFEVILLQSYLFAVVIIYTNYTPEPTSFLVKLVAASLVTLQLVLSITTYTVSNALQTTYQPVHQLAEHQRWRFTPTANGYTATRLPYYFDQQPGLPLTLDTQTNELRSVLLPLDFAFAFYGQPRAAVTVNQNGVLTFNQPYDLRRFDGHAQPAIVPLHLDVDNADGAITYVQTAAALTITWQQVRSKSGGGANTFQVLLQAGGVIEFAYAALALPPQLNPDGDQGLWLVGLLPGDGSIITTHPHFSGDETQIGPLIGALVENYKIDFRQYLHRHLLPFAMLAVGTTLFILIAFPLFFNINLIRPLTLLVAAMRQVDSGNLTVAAPVQFSDEIGFLTTSFNEMIRSLRTSRAELQTSNLVLEARVVERTDALNTAKEAAEVAKATAEAANRAKSLFLTNMSHELRTPLNAILGYAQLLQRQPPAPQHLREAPAIIYQSGEHLLNMINDVLDLAKIEAGKAESHPTVVDLPALLQGLVKLVQFQAQQKQLHFAATFAPDLPTTILVDGSHLRQILLNLLGNAVKFTAQGTVSLAVSRVDRPWPGATDGETAAAGAALAHLHFAVHDTGSGIDPAAQARILLPFEQAGDAASRARGTGLGLTISQRLLELMGSTLQCRSAVGQGSTFWFDVALPVVTVTVTAPPPGLAGYTGARQTALIVDDEMQNRQVLAAMLELVGFQVVQASDGQAGVAQAHRHQPALICLDLAMPVMDGFAALAAIRQSPPLAHCVVFAVSASVFMADQARCLAAGFDAFLPKPVNERQLEALLVKHLDLAWDMAAAVPGTPLPAFASPALIAAAQTHHALANGANDDPSDDLSKNPVDLAALGEAIQLGDLRRVHTLAAELAAQDALLTPFTDQVQTLALAFEEKALIAFWNAYQAERKITDATARAATTNDSGDR